MIFPKVMTSPLYQTVKSQKTAHNKSKCQGISLNKVKLNNELEIREHTASVPPMLRNRSMVPRSGFRGRLVFSGREVPDSALLSASSLTTDQHGSERISSLEMSKVSQ